MNSVRIAIAYLILVGGQVAVAEEATTDETDRLNSLVEQLAGWRRRTAATGGS